ncbi:MAG: T9SS type A sorting domain-containing protein [Bacteroidetes bacterium]|nr:T9SS type A sorting domain-containing protein [Bacteroidota bacterium]
MIVGAYTFVGGALNDSGKLWINPAPSSFGGAEPTPTLTSTTSTEADLTSVVRFFFRQDATTKTPFLEADELRLGTSWADVVPSGGSSHVETMNNAVPQSLQLAQNFPNPFNPSTTIEFAVASTQLVTVKVHDMLGREVATLVDHTLNPGSYRTKWNAMDNPSGLYFYTVRAGNETLTRRMALVK